MKTSQPNRTPRPARSQRRGVILTIEMLFVLPLLIITGLIVAQFIMIVAADHRVQTAAITAADLAANGASAAQIHQEAGLVLTYLGAEYQTEIEYLELGGDPDLIDAGIDQVVVGVRIPMGLVSTNYLGLAGASVNGLHVRSVSQRTATETFPHP
jgi:hypothetical protein